jgi:small subunit ribosomal protein S6
MPASQIDNRRKYEAVIIINPDASEEDQKNVLRRNRDIIQNFKGEIHHIDTWGKRKLANPINKFARGNYFHMTFEAKGEAVAELERTMRINDQVLRFQHTRLDDRVSLAKFVEKFKDALAEAAQRERDREAKNQQRRAAMMAARKSRDQQ